jgi:hypothetical protein
VDTTDQPLTEPVPSIHRDRIRIITLMMFIIIALIISVDTLLFTPWGNRQLAPIVENKIEAALGQPITLASFVLTLTHFELALADKTENTVHIEGKYVLFPPKIDAHYDANLSTAEGLNIAGFPLDINGSLTGYYQNLSVLGTVHLFSGAVDYNSTLLFGSPNTLNITCRHIEYQQLMDILEYPHESDTLIDGELHINGIKRRDINATGALTATTHRFKPSPLIEETNESFDFWSLIADKKGKIQPFTIDAHLQVHVDELGILEQFVSYPLQTSASVNATLKGSQHQLVLDADAKAAQSDTHSRLTLHKLRPSQLKLDIQHADIPSLFTLLSLPSPITGKLNAQADTDFSKSTLSLEVKKAQTQPAILKRDYGITQPSITFDSSFKMSISPKERHYTGTFTSDLEDIRFDGSPTHDQMLQELLRQINQNRPKGKI